MRNWHQTKVDPKVELLAKSLYLPSNLMVGNLEETVETNKFWRNLERTPGVAGYLAVSRRNRNMVIVCINDEYYCAAGINVADVILRERGYTRLFKVTKHEAEDVLRS
jgi:hypothetical protein